MKSLFRLSSLLFAALTLVFSTAPMFTAHAQDICFGLSADDCNLVKAASTTEAYAKLTSFSMTHALTLTSSDGSGTKTDFSLTGSGSYWSDQPFVLSTDATETPNTSLTMQDVVTITTKTADKGPRDTKLELRVVNGTLYFQTGAGKWISASLEALRNSKLPMLGALGGDPTQFTASLKAAFEALSGAGIVSAERAADTAGDNQQIAGFVFHFDLAKAATEGNFKPILKLLGTGFGPLADMSDEDLVAKKDQLAKAFKNSQLSITRYIGLNDKLPHGIGIDLVANIDPADFAALTGTPDPDEPTPDASGPKVVNYHYEFKISGIGNKVEVTAPADAIQMPGLK